MGTRHQGPLKEVRSLDAFVKLMRASETLALRLTENLAERGLTLAQLGALEALHHLGAMSHQELGHKLLRSKSNMCTVLDNLEAAGLVERVRSETDRRVVFVSLTRSGRKLIGEVFPEHARHITEMMGALTAAEQVELAALCKKLGLAARTRGGSSR